MKTKLMFVALMIIVVSSSAFASCESTAFASENRMNGNNFYGLILKTNAQVILSQGTETSVRIEGDAKNVSFDCFVKVNKRIAKIEKRNHCLAE